MTAAALIAAAGSAGVTMRIDGDRLVLSAPYRPNDELLEELRREKLAIVAYLRELAAWSEEDWNALYDERAGIMEYDGGLSRGEAEDRAAEEVRQLRSFVRSGDV